MTAIEKIQQWLGGEAVTGPLRNDFDLMRLIRQGLPASAVGHFLDASHLSYGEIIETHVVPRRTFNRRRERLDPAESDRLVRVVRLVANAHDTFGDADKALAWLGRANRALDGQTPLSLADTDQGVRSVEALLGRIAHGIAA